MAYSLFNDPEWDKLSEDEKPGLISEYVDYKLKQDKDWHSLSESEKPGIRDLYIEDVTNADKQRAEDRIPKDGSTLGALAKTAMRIPENLIAKGIQAIQGQEGASYTDRGIADKYVNFVENRNRELAKEYSKSGDVPLTGGLISKKDVAELGPNLAYSGLSMLGSIGGGMAGGAAGAPIGPAGAAAGGVAAGMAASGALAHRMTTYQTMNDWLEQKNKESIEKTGVGITPEQEAIYKKELESAATKSGFWESVPEAAGNALELAVMKSPMGRIIEVLPKGVKGKVLSGLIRATGVLAPELTTETITQMGQQRTESEAGMSDESQRQWNSVDDWLKSAQEVLPSVLLQSGVMAGGGAAYRKIAGIKPESENQIPQDQAQQPVQPAHPPQPPPATDPIKATLGVDDNASPEDVLFGRVPVRTTPPTDRNELQAIDIRSQEMGQGPALPYQSTKEPEDMGAWLETLKGAEDSLYEKDSNEAELNQLDAQAKGKVYAENTIPEIQPEQPKQAEQPQQPSTSIQNGSIVTDGKRTGKVHAISDGTFRVAIEQPDKSLKIDTFKSLEDLNKVWGVPGEEQKKTTGIQSMVDRLRGKDRSERILSPELKAKVVSLTSNSKPSEIRNVAKELGIPVFGKDITNSSLLLSIEKEYERMTKSEGDPRGNRGMPVINYKEGVISNEEKGKAKAETVLNSGKPVDDTKPAEPGLIRSRDVYGNYHYVKQGDLDNDKKTLLKTYSKDGKAVTTKVGFKTIHKDNLDPTGEKQKANNEKYGVPDVIPKTTKDGDVPFESIKEAQSFIAKQGIQDTHEAVKLPKHSDYDGFIIKKKTVVAEQTKQPWQQTVEEFIGDKKSTDAIAISKSAHANHVREAVQRGENVPFNVLGQYKSNVWAQKAIEAKTKSESKTPSPMVLSHEDEMIFRGDIKRYKQGDVSLLDDYSKRFSERIGEQLTHQQTEDLMIEMIRQAKQRGEHFIFSDANPTQAMFAIDAAWKVVKEKQTQQPSESTATTTPNAVETSQTGEGIQGQGSKSFNPLGILTGEVKPEIKNDESEKTKSNLDSIKSELLSEIADWKSRKYKDNNKIVSVGGTSDDFQSGDITISAANEKRRKREIASREKAIADIESYQKRIDAGEDIQSIMYDLEDSPFNIVDRLKKKTGKPEPKTIEAEPVPDINKMISDLESETSGPVVDARKMDRLKQLKKIAAKTDEVKPDSDYGKNNKIFTEERANKAREILRKKLGQLNAGIDPEILAAGIEIAGYHIEAGARTFADYSKRMIADLGDAVRPYLKSFYNAVRDYPGIDNSVMTSYDEVSKTDVNTIEKETTTQKNTPSHSIASWVSEQFGLNKKFTWQELFAKADEAFGGTQAQGKYTPKDAYDAMELGVNKFILENKNGMYDPNKEEKAASFAISGLKARVKHLLPTQTKRTAEQDEFQQFSTPPHLAYTAAWAANISSNDVILEPSAGVGGLAVFAKNADANAIYVNELSPRRAELLDAMGFDKVFRENAEQINNILPSDIKPTVVLMNPPFSATAGRMQGQRKTINATKHIEQALKRLEEGGRLVAIVGEGMKEGAPTFKKWWEDTKKQYSVLANIGINGDEYAKYGTTFDNQILVIDKIAPNKDTKTITGKVEKVEDLLPLLKGARDARQTVALDKASRDIEQAGNQSTVSENAQEGESGNESGSPVLPSTGNVGDRGTKGGLRGLRGSIQPSESDRGLDVSTASGMGDAGVDESGGRRGHNELPDGQKRSGGRSSDNNKSTGQPSNGADRGISSSEKLQIESVDNKNNNEISDSLYEQYKPEKVTVKGSKHHPTPLVQSAAMASVSPPTPKYTPSLPKESIEKGKISDAQIESVVYAGEAHSETLPGGERKGFFIGDGTGVGKGREIASIFLDNWNNGRKKGIWISEKSSLFKDAQKDSNNIGWDKSKIFNKVKSKEKIKQSEGVLFTTYDTLKSDMDKEGLVSRINQIVDWVGKDFDGVIAFDEAHNMGNSKDERGTRGVKKASQKALAGIRLQQALPNARIVYVSATGATELKNLLYCERLGLWGEGTPFPNKSEFLNQISRGGTATMEMVAQNMKASGVYISRSLSYDGVEYGRLEHTLTPDQRLIYDKLAEGWQNVLRNINEALGITNASEDSNQKKNIYGAFWTAQQRFFNQIITSMQTPSVIQKIHDDLKKGESVIIQLTNTQDSAMQKAIDKAIANNESFDDIDVTPRDTFMQMVQNSFPVNQYEKYIDSEGNEQTRIVLDSEGKPVLNQEAVAMRERLLDEIGSIRIPDSPIDMIINEFGVDNVAEITGRKRRIVKRETDNGLESLMEKRSDNAIDGEVDEFMNDKRQILIFSEKGGTGRSYHADLDSKNQRKRNHYLLQAGWRADKAVQGLGRSHRSNQKQPPIYFLVTTDLKGQKRFLSSIARRLDQLGALTKGQRETGSQGIFQAKDNLESDYAVSALNELISNIVHGRNTEISQSQFEQETGLKLIDYQGNIKYPPVTQFLNRLLSLSIDNQNKAFDEFSNIMDRIIEYHAERGTLDTGVETITANSVKKIQDKIVYSDPKTDAKTRYVELELEKPTLFREFWAVSDHKFFINNKSKKIWAVKERTTTEARTGDVTDVYDLRSITYKSGTRTVLKDSLDESKFTKVSENDANRLWNEAIKDAPQTYTDINHLITGLLLPVWDRLVGWPKLVRTQTSNGEKLIGRLIAESDIESTLENLGANNKEKVYAHEQVHNNVLEKGYKYYLANKWTIEKRTVSGEQRIELTGPDYSHGDILKKYGIFSERIQWETRYFIPTNSDGVKSVEKLISYYPIIREIKPNKSNDIDFSTASTAPQEQNQKRIFGKPTAHKAIDHYSKVIETAKNGNVNITIVDSVDDIHDIRLKEALKNHQDKNNVYVRGLFHKPSKSLYIITDGMKTMKEVGEVISHELIGHHGLYEFMGDDLNPFLDHLINHKEYGKLVSETGTKRKINTDTIEGQRKAAREYFAELVEKGEYIEPSLWTRFVTAFRNAMRRWGFRMELSDSEIAEIVRGARMSATESNRQTYRDSMGDEAVFGLDYATTTKPQTETPEFKKWSNGNPVVDIGLDSLTYPFKTGSPVVVKGLHGTNSVVDFNKIEKTKLGSRTFADSARKGFFLAAGSSTANFYANPFIDDIQNQVTKENNYFLTQKGGLNIAIEKLSKINDELNTLKEHNNKNEPDYEKRKQVIEQSKFIKSTLDQAKNLKKSDYVNNKDLEPLVRNLLKINVANPEYNILDAIPKAEIYFSRGRVYPIYARMDNPLVYDFKGKNYRDQTYSDIINSAQEKGHDGVILTNTFDGGNEDNIYVVFEPNQIKSATGNRGTFDPNDDRIDYSDSPIRLDTDENEIHEPISRWIEKKKDITWADKLVSLPMYYFKKVPQLHEAYLAASKYVNDKFENQRKLLYTEDGKSMTAMQKEFEKTNPEEYKKMNQYMLHQDMMKNGYHVIYSKKQGDYYIKAPGRIADAQGNPLPEWKTTDKRFRTKAEAWAFADNMETERYMAMGGSQAGAEMLKSYRTIGHNMFNMLYSPMERMIAEAKAKNLPEPKITIRNDAGELEKVSLSVALSKMGELEGSYFPRKRESGRYVLKAVKDGENPIRKHFDLALKFKDEKDWKSKVPLPINIEANKLIKQGYSVTFEESDALPESVFVDLAGQQMALDAVLNKAIDNISKGFDTSLKDIDMDSRWITDKNGNKTYQVFGGGYEREYADILKELGGEYRYIQTAKSGMPTIEFKNPSPGIENKVTDYLFSYKMIDAGANALLAGTLATELSDMLKARGARSSMISRGKQIGKDVWKGYEEDATTAFTKSAMGIAGSTAKGVMAKRLIEIQTGRKTTWSDYKENTPDAKFGDWLQEMRDNRIDPAEQPKAYQELSSYTKEMLRNEEQLDRVIGTVHGIAALKYLAFRLSSAATNLTSLATSVPATLTGMLHVPLHKVPGILAKSMNDYRTYKFGDGKKLDLWSQKAFEHIEKEGWDQQQLNHEAMQSLQGKLGKKYNWLMEKGMLAFKVTEMMNRVSTIMAAYNGIKDSHKGEWTQANHTAALNRAKEVSDHAHGDYFKGNQPSFTRGGGVGGNVAKMAYIFKMYQHNYLLNMKKLGFEDKEYKAMAYMAISPMVLAGAGAGVMTPIISAILSALGIGGDDPEEEFYRWMEKEYGKSTSDIARTGLLGFGGASFTGAMDVNILQPPKNFAELLGAPGGVAKDLIDGFKQFSQGNNLKGFEKVLPAAVSNPVRAYRESTEGFTTGKNTPIFYGRDQLKLDAVESAYRFLGFNPARTAIIQAQRYGEQKANEAAQEKLNTIHMKAKKLFLQPINERSEKESAEIMLLMNQYNEAIQDDPKLRLTRTPVTWKRVMQGVNRNLKPSKSERLRETTNNFLQ